MLRISEVCISPKKGIMKFSVSYEHRQFFQQNQYIEFDELLSEHQLTELKKAIDSVLANRLSMDEASISKQPADKLFAVGHDLWRANDSIKKFITHPQLTTTAAELVETKELRLGYDLLIPQLTRRFHLTKGERSLEVFLEKSHSLDEMSGLQGIACGLLICLSAPLKVELSSNEPYFPTVPGNGVFLSPELVVEFQKIAPQQSDYLLIVYTYSTAFYYLNEINPHAHALKHLGYHFGDKLTDKLNPIVFRSKGG